MKPVTAATRQLQYIQDPNDLDLATQDSIFRTLSSKINKEQHLLPQSSGDLMNQFLKGLSIVVIDEDGTLVGHATLWKQEGQHEIGDVFELGTTWVDVNLRGNGLNENMYERFLKRHEDKLIIATTTNPASVRVGNRVGLRQVLRRSLPMAIWNESCCCPFSKTSSETSDYCSRANGEPQLYHGNTPCVFRMNRSMKSRLGL